jgi:hypothetical protein
MMAGTYSTSCTASQPMVHMVQVQESMSTAGIITAAGCTHQGTAPLLLGHASGGGTRLNHRTSGNCTSASSCLYQGKQHEACLQGRLLQRAGATLCHQQQWRVA